MIPESFIEELKYASGIEQVISSYVSLKRAGNRLVGLCPFHSEKTPSFTVFADAQQSFYCFGCSKGGDVITFIREVENLGYIDALHFLAGRAGLTVPEDSGSEMASRLRSRILEMNRLAARYYHEQLNSDVGHAARAYLEGRGLSRKTIRRFGIGFSPDGWSNLRDHLRSNGFSDEDIQAAALIREGRSGATFDTFRGRVMFPILDLRGAVIGFGGRLMEGDGPKYINSPDTPVFKKSRHLFALNFAKAAGSDTLILGEGYMDVIAMHQAGFENSVATLGTALTAEQSRLIAQYSKRVVLAYDSDTAGQSASGRAINLFGHTGVEVSVLSIEDAKDPDEYIQKYGAARFERMLEGGKSAVDFEIGKLRARFNLSDAQGRVMFLNAFCALMAGIQSNLTREVYISSIAEELNIGREGLLSSVNSLRRRNLAETKKREAHNLATYAQDNLGTAERRQKTGNIAGLAAMEQLIMLLMRHPDFYSAIAGQLSASDIEDDGLARIYTLISERLSENLSIDPVYLSGALEPKEMGKLTGLLVKSRELSFTRGQSAEFIDVIKKSKTQKSVQELSEMSTEEYAQYITSLRAQKL